MSTSAVAELGGEPGGSVVRGMMLGGRESCGLRKISLERRLSHALRGEFSSPRGKEGEDREGSLWDSSY